MTARLQVPTYFLPLLLATFQVHLSTCAANNCYPQSHVCPFTESAQDVSGLVTPTLPPSDENCNLHVSHCQLLECYLTCLNNTYHQLVNLTFLPGLHQGKNLQVYTSAQVVTLVGKYDGSLSWSQIHITNFTLIAKFDYTSTCDNSRCLLKSFFMNNMIASNVYIAAHCHLGAPCYIGIDEFIFNEVTIMASNAVVRLNNVQFHNGTSTALALYFCLTTVGGNVSFVNNTGIKGGAMALYSSLLEFSDELNSIMFKQNRAMLYGGAIYIEGTNELGITSCFYGMNSDKLVEFKENSAVVSGDHIYGASMKSTCLDYSTNTPSYKIVKIFFKFTPDLNDTLSGISGEPSRVCICQDNLPQCANPAKIINYNIQVYPGESFTIDCVIVGGDFGTTTGTVYASIESLDNSTDYLPILASPYMYNQVINRTRECTKLQYTLLSNTTGITVMFVLRATETAMSENIPNNITDLCQRYEIEQIITPELINTPVVIPLVIQPCPIGFVLQQSTQDHCDCYTELYEVLKSVTCIVQNGYGYISWNGSTWLGGIVEGNDSIGIAYSKYCPTDNCNTISEMVDLRNDPDAQCAFNHQGRLCGGCKENYSLEIGSSHCVYCSNNNGLALIIISFAAAGFLLIAVICLLNLTITNGTINGLLFYANVIWAYQHVLFPQKMSGYLQFLRVFIAWVNLDLGIRTCFIIGLNAFWKMWLQFLFPIYTAGIFFFGLRFSDRLSRLLGGRALHTFATLFFLSNTKLLRTIIATLMLAKMETYPDGTAYYVWAVDGNLQYGHFPHIVLLLVSIFCLVVFWIPYTLLLFSMQWLRRVDHYGPLKYIGKQKPLIDAHYAPLRDKHHYWLGVLMLSLGVILTVSSLTLNIIPTLSEYILIVIATLLFWYSSSARVYKKRYLLIIENSFLINLILLFIGLQHEFPRPILMSVSLSIAFFEFCGIICWNTLPYMLKRMGCIIYYYEQYRNKLQYEDMDHEGQNQENNIDQNVLEDNRVRETLLD